MQRIMSFVVAAFGLLIVSGCTRTVYVDRVVYAPAPMQPSQQSAPYTSPFGPPQAQQYAPAPVAVPPPVVTYSEETQYYAPPPTYYVSPPYTTYSSGVYLGVGPIFPGYGYGYGYRRRGPIVVPRGGYYRGGGYRGGYHGGGHHR